MAENNREEERLPKRRPFTFDVHDSKMVDVLEAYRQEDELLFLRKDKDQKKRRFLK